MIDQRHQALAAANRRRAERAHFKRQLRAEPDQAPWMVGRLLEAPPEWAASWYVYDLLEALPKFGRVKVSRLMTRQQISLRRRVGALTPRQRRALQEELVGRFAR